MSTSNIKQMLDDDQMLQKISVNAFEASQELFGSACFVICMYSLLSVLGPVLVELCKQRHQHQPQKSHFGQALVKNG